MKLPLQIHFKDLRRDEAVESLIKEKVNKLERMSPDMIHCRVTIALPHRSHRKGNFFDVRIDISLPGKEIAVTRESHDEIENTDLRHVIKDSFDRATREIVEYKRMNAA